jgi:hypothetical protein
VHREEGHGSRTLAPHNAHSTARSSVASVGEEACKAARKAGGREVLNEGWVSCWWRVETDTGVCGGTGPLVQWISRERPKEISNPLESRERSPVWERGGAVCGGGGLSWGVTLIM